MKHRINMEQYINEINRQDFADLTDEGITIYSKELRDKSKHTPINELIASCFALYKEAAKRCLGLVPFDEQLLAAMQMHFGNLIQMQTGEGKTLAAVATAYINSFVGKVHILTFNDYLAKRDCTWMQPLYDMLGITVSYISEGMTSEERLKSYECDVVYLTAKEAGFDYLRDFLCTDSAQILHKNLDFAIVDEADSILIDEARIPLVIAGRVQALLDTDGITDKVNEAVLELSPSEYERDEQQNSVSLTEQGIERLEAKFEVDNLYDNDNIELLSMISSALLAHYKLKCDVDYIVRDGQILLIDEFTGRIAENRHYPDDLQNAVETKEGISPDSRGQILGTIAVQYFMRIYKRITGMTGTAVSSKEEFKKLYDLDVAEIPTHKPCIREVAPMAVYTHSEAKWDAVVNEISAANKRGQPVLVGTADIVHSERLAQRLTSIGIKCSVLNAKNDEQEALLISKAGDFGMVTISTNMAGRGVDIKLGGENEENHDKVTGVGGLYVIATVMHESARIDAQLSGRCARQGDVGKYRLFVSLEDEIMKTHDICSLIPAKHYPRHSNEEVTNAVALRECDRIQRIAQGKTFDLRTHLLKYTYIIEEQRKAIFERRRAILLGESRVNILSEQDNALYELLCSRFGENEIIDFQQSCLLSLLNRHWAQYTDYTFYLREGIHLTVIGGKNPIEEFNIAVEEAYQNMQQSILDDVIKQCEVLLEQDSIESAVSSAITAPSATWTYLMDDSGNQFSRLPVIIKSLLGDDEGNDKKFLNSSGFFSKVSKWFKD